MFSGARVIPRAGAGLSRCAGRWPASAGGYRRCCSWRDTTGWPSGDRGAPRTPTSITSAGRMVGRVVLLVPAAIFCAWGLARSYLSLLTMFGHRAVERTPAEAWDLLRAGWHDPAIVAPGLQLLPYFLVLAIPLAGVLWAVS